LAVVGGFEIKTTSLFSGSHVITRPGSLRILKIGEDVENILEWVRSYPLTLG